MKFPDLSEFPWKTALGIAFLAFQAYAYYRQGRYDQMNECIGLAIGILGIRSGVARDQKETRAVSGKLDDAHAAVVEAHSAIARTEAKIDATVARLSGDSIPVVRPTERVL